MAGHDGKIYINLMDDAGRAVEVSASGWKPMPDPPVRFIKSKNARPMPEPDPEGTLDILDELLNVESPEDRDIIVAWMFNAFFPKGPYPILVINGEQGSAKTTTTKIIRSIIDPATALTRSLPGSERDLMVAASHSWILCYDMHSPALIPTHNAWGNSAALPAYADSCIPESHFRGITASYLI